MHRTVVAACAACIATLASAEPPALELHELLAEADAASPALAAAAARAAAAAELPGQLAAPEDPELTLGLANESLDSFTLGEAPDSAINIAWSQPVRRGAKRGASASVARAERDLRLIEVELARRTLREQVVRTFAELWRIDRTLAVLEDSRLLLVAAAESARVQYEAGHGVQQGVLRAQTEVRRLDAEIEHVRRTRRQALLALGAALGRPEVLPAAPVGELPGLAVGEEVLAQLAEEPALDAPAAAAARTREDRADASRRAARAATQSDMSWSAAWAERGSLDPVVSGSIAFRLPIHRARRQLPGIALAEQELAAAAAERAAVEIEVRRAARDAADEALHAASLVRQYSRVIVPQATSTVAAAREALAAGRLEMPALLADLQGLLGDRVAEIAERAHLVQAVAALETLTGRSLLTLDPPGVRP